MVLGRLIRSIGLGKAQAAPEEKPSTTPSDSSEDSMLDSAVTPDSVVYSKDMLLQFRSLTDSQDSDEVAQAMPTAKEQSSEAASEMDRSISTRSSPKSVDSTPNSQFGALSPSAGSWAAAMQNKRNSKTDEAAEDEKVTRKACSILNKLTVEKFDSLFEQLATCGINKPQHLEILMREVFLKATTQHHFIAMYADLCVRLEQDLRISSVIDSTGQQHSFRRLLLNQCQSSFEQLLQPSNVAEETVEKCLDEELAIKRKQQALGNIKLIGQLLVCGIVTSKLLVECSEELLRCRDSCPEALESLAALLTVAGKQFDTKSWQYYPRLLEVFSCMRKLSKDKKTSARVRFLLRDVLDVRDAGWSNCTYKQTLTTAPMKLEEVRESAANEGKYMSLEDQIETDTLLSGLMKVSQQANARKDMQKAKDGGYSSPDCTPIQSKPSRQNKLTAAAPWKVSKEASCVNELAGKKQELNEQKQCITEAMSRIKEAISNSSATSPREVEQFDVVSFRRALAGILSDLSSDRNVPAAVRRIRLQEVPLQFQAKEFADIITRIVEERRGPVRRIQLAFATGLGAAEGESAFDRKACLDGVSQFFNDVYPELCTEIARLPSIVSSELLPTLRNVYSKGELHNSLPESLDLKSSD